MLSSHGNRLKSLWACTINLWKATIVYQSVWKADESNQPSICEAQRFHYQTLFQLCETRNTVL